MRVLNVVTWTAGVLAALAAGVAAAATIIVTFPEFNGPPVVEGPFPQPPLTVQAQTFSIPAGDRIVSAVMSGYWGTSDWPIATAGVTVFVDGVMVAQCEKPDPGCFADGIGQRAWGHAFTDAELLPLSDGSATVTAVQTSAAYIRLGVTKLVIETVPRAVVPTLSPPGLLALLIAMAVAGTLGARRYLHR